MRIGMILDKTFPPDPRVENEALSLSERGFEVFLFCLTYDSNSGKDKSEGFQVLRYSSNLLTYKLSALAYTIPCYTWIMKRKIKSFLIDYNIEAVHIHDMRIAAAVFSANRKLKLPVVLDLHDNMPEIMKTYPHLQKFPGKWLISPKAWEIKEAEFIKQADRVITVSSDFVDDIVQRTGTPIEKMCLVPNTVRRSFFESYKTDEFLSEKYKQSFNILYLGDTGLRRGVLTAIEALPDLIKEIPLVKLIIVGKSSTDHVLKAKAESLNISDHVVFEGWQDVNLFPTYILLSDICISPLYRNKQHDVAYANKLFQYMSFGKPVLVSNATAQKNLIENVESGLVHEAQNTKDFVEKAITLFKDKELSKKLGENGRNFIDKQYSWEKTSEKLIDLYKNLNS